MVPSSNNFRQLASGDMVGTLTLQQGDIISNMSSNVTSTTFTTHSINLYK